MFIKFSWDIINNMKSKTLKMSSIKSLAELSNFFAKYYS